MTPQPRPKVLCVDDEARVVQGLGLHLRKDYEVHTALGGDEALKSLKQIVHFYNTRDVYPFNVTSGHCPAGTTEKVNCWPLPEVNNMVDTTTGKLGLTDQEENQIVTFLQTLTDGFTTPYPDINTFTGQCMMGGSAATQGNASIIPAPTPLPPCASAICGVAPLPGPQQIP